MKTPDQIWNRPGAESAYALLRDAVLVAAALPTTLAAYQLHHLLGTTPVLVHWAVERHHRPGRRGAGQPAVVGRGDGARRAHRIRARRRPGGRPVGQNPLATVAVSVPPDLVHHGAAPLKGKVDESSWGAAAGVSGRSAGLEQQRNGQWR